MARSGMPTVGCLQLETLEDRHVPAILLVDTAAGGTDLADGKLSFAEAMDTAQDGDTIQFDEAIHGSSIPYDFRFFGGITIDGPGADLITLDGQGDRNTLVNQGVTEIRGVTIANFRGEEGAIRNFGDLTLADCVFSQNTGIPFYSAGAIRNSGRLTVEGCAFIDNASQHFAGAILNEAGAELEVYRSHFEGNRLTGDEGAGAIANDGGSLQILDSTFIGNQAPNAAPLGAGAVYSNGTVSGQPLPRIAGSRFIGNEAAAGGAVSNLGRLVIEGSLFDGNQAFSGGAIENSGLLSIRDTSFIHNRALDGGAISTFRGNLTLANVTLSGNQVEGIGGAIRNVQSWIEVVNSTVVDNRSGEGGAGIDNERVLGSSGLSRGSNTLLQNSIVAGNVRVGEDGATQQPSDIAGLPLVPLSSHNLIGDPDSAGGLFEGVLGNRVGDGTGGLLPLAQIVEPLAIDTQGGLPTHSLTSDSRARNAGDNALAVEPGRLRLLSDQRGAPFVRIAGPGVDLGAVEAQDPVFVVDALGDRSDGNFNLGEFTLREAIEQANATGDRVRIGFAEALVGQTIVLEGTPLPTVEVDLSLVGPGAESLTIDAAGQSRILDLELGTSVTIRGLTFQGGNTPGNGGAIQARGEHFILTDSRLVGNTAERGGALALVAGTAELERVWLQDNTAAEIGGAIANLTPSNSLSLQGATVEGSTAGLYGGGIFSNGPLTVSQSTISGNRAEEGGGGIEARGPSFLAGLTIVANQVGEDRQGAGLQIAPAVGMTLNNSIVAGNARDMATPEEIHGQLAANSANNLIGDPATAGGLVEGSNGNRVGDGLGNLLPLADILELTLARNGGPMPTHALVAGSRALDGGGATSEPFDQRGGPYARRFGTASDIGAFEVQSTDLLVVATLEDTTDGDTSPDGLSLREALAFANSRPGEQQIAFAAALEDQVLMVNEASGLPIADDVTILGPGSDQLVLDGTLVNAPFFDLPALFQVLTGVDVTVQGLTLARSPSSRVALWNQGNLVLEDVQFAQNGFTGSALNNDVDANLTVRASRFTDLGLRNEGNATVQRTTFAGNTSPGGGAIGNWQGSLTITESTFVANAAAEFGGGAIYNEASLIVDASLFANNTSVLGGGGAIANNGNLTITNSTFTDNRANQSGGSGGAIHNLRELTIINSTIVGNGAVNAFGIGGGLYAPETSVSFTSSTTLHNTIVAGNYSGETNSPSTAEDVIGVLTPDSAHNLIGNPATTGGLSHASNGNVLGDGQGNLLTLAQIMRPYLDANGGPTLTFALVPGSVARDAGSDAQAMDAMGNPLAYDQRGTGFARRQGTVDIGAFEEQATTLQVVQLTPTSEGFVVRFSRPISQVELNLYDSEGIFGPPDLSLVGAEGEIRGSLLPDEDGYTFTFIATGGRLSAGTYRLTLRSGVNAFADAMGEVLDGDGDGTAGGDYTGVFTVLATNTVVVSLPDFARGSGQSVAVPNTAVGLPLRLSDASEVTSVRLEVVYNPALLTITEVQLAEDLPQGATITLDVGVPGMAVVTFTSPSPLAGLDRAFASLIATVPEGPPPVVGQKLQVQGVSINGGLIPSGGDAATQVLGYFGDVNADGRLTVADVVGLLRQAAGLDMGFADYPLIDPRLLGDMDGNQVLTVGDVSLLLNQVAGRTVPQIPAIP